MTRQQVRLHRLVDLVRRFETGEIVLSPFQRPYVWGETEILALFESIYRGHPIGTLVFWSAPEHATEPAAPNRAEASGGRVVEYVIDGTQRLLTLHRCLTPRRNGIDERFQVGFDLDRERFVSLSFDDLPEAYVNLSSVLSPGIYDEIQSNASRARFGDLVRAVSELHRRIIGYEVPVMSIQGTGTNDVITVFESLNQKGVRLSKADLRRAEAARITVPE